WSEGVNESWMRGGEESAARFSLLTQLTPEARNLVYKALKEKLSGKKFLEEVKQSLPEDRTLWHSKEKRPTYYAKELAHLIDNGYVLSQPITDDAPSPNTTAHFGKSLARILGANFERDINKKKQELTKPKDN
ncbi:hypothetical protein, partial [Plantactinospora endophytica]|uniref:hypothetical protein n=1 Tax=Plantactinospora endophytica TaxID=673535 RepID=UPI003645A955